MRRNAILFAVLVVALLVAVIGMTPLGYLPAPLSTPVFCSNMPFYDPSQDVVAPTTFPQATGPKLRFARVIDLDPTIPDDSKGALVVRRVNGDYEYALHATEEQKEGYLKSLHVGDCWRTSVLPACLLGHFPGEPPGRKPCVVPTPKPKTK